MKSFVLLWTDALEKSHPKGGLKMRHWCIKDKIIFWFLFSFFLFTDSGVHVSRCEKGQSCKRGRDPASCRHWSPQCPLSSCCPSKSTSPCSLPSWVHPLRAARGVRGCHSPQWRGEVILHLSASFEQCPITRGTDGGGDRRTGQTASDGWSVRVDTVMKGTKLEV